MEGEVTDHERIERLEACLTMLAMALADTNPHIEQMLMEMAVILNEDDMAIANP